MPRFQFVARDRLGASRTGVMEQASLESTVDTLRQRNWLVIEVHPEADASQSGGLLATIAPGNWLPVGLSQVELSLRQLAVMLNSGLALLNALRLLHEHAERGKVRRIWQQVADAILAGETLATAMQRQRCFPQVVIQLARVGEQTGELNETLLRAADILEARRRLRSQILSALAYPIIVSLASIGVAGFMDFNVIPKLQTFLRALGRDLPPLTQMLVDVTEFIHTYVVHGAVALVVLIGGIFALRAWPPGRWWCDRILLRVPIVGGVLRVAGTAALARNLQTLLQSGVSLLDSLRSIEMLLASAYLADCTARARAAIVEGQTLAEGLALRRAFTPMLIRMVAIGESAGRLDEVLSEAAVFYEDQLARKIRTLAAMVEPAMLLIVGGIVGFVYIAFFMALFAAAR